MSLVMGIDLGTQSCKVLVYDFTKKDVLFRSSSPHQIISAEDGTREQESHWWIAAFRNCVLQIPEDLKKRIAAIGVSGQQHGFVPLGKNHRVLYRVKLWCDTSTSKECAEITEAFGGEEKLLREVGNPIFPGYTASKILWLKKNHPDIYKEMAYILLPHDYLNFYLTGEIKMEAGDASGTGFLDIRKRQWHKGLLQCIDPQRDLAKCLPPLISSTQPCGALRAEVASETGLLAGIPVSAGGGDNMMAAIGTGALESGRITASLGTSGTLFATSKKPLIDPEGRLAAFCSSSGSWLPLLCTMNCTIATEQMRDLLDIDLKNMENLASEAPIGSEGIITLPFYNGERVPNLPNGKGCLMGMNLFNVKPQNILRSAMEAAILGLKQGIEAFSELGFKVKALNLTGGGAKSRLWRQITADICGLPAAVPAEEEGAAFGAALQALHVLYNERSQSTSLEEISQEHVQFREGQEHHPDPSKKAEYEKLYHNYQHYLSLVKKDFS